MSILLLLVIHVGGLNEPLKDSLSLNTVDLNRLFLTEKITGTTFSLTKYTRGQGLFTELRLKAGEA